jgi:uncharacterized protein YjlB
MTVIRDILPITLAFADDGLVPNNSLPFVVYKSVVLFDDSAAEDTIERLFGANGWGRMWRDGVFDFLHYHATVHEALGVAHGRALVRFGGDRGEDVEMHRGDVAILPAGTGHQCLAASPDFVVVGAYPPGPAMEITRPTPENHRKALATIPKVPRPATDPVYGADGPLPKLWSGAG